MKINLLENFLINWNNHFKEIANSNAHFFIAVSGGVDSVVLTDLMSKTSFSFSILHCNFNLRNDESKRDEIFVQSLATKYNTTVLVEHFDTNSYALEHKLSIQVAARNLRYNWFKNIIEQNTTTNKKCFLLTAHQADDTIETVLMNIFRGTGLKGLHGISMQNNYILRPLLFARRSEIEQYAKQNNLDWVEDSSNKKVDYTRNNFRLNIIPLIKEHFLTVEENLLANIEKWKEAEVIYNLYINEQKQKLIEVKDNTIQIPILKLQQQKAVKTVLYEIIANYGFTANQLKDAIELLDAATGKYIVSATHRILKNRKWVIITPLKSNNIQHFIIEQDDKKIFFDSNSIEIKIIENSEIQSNSNIACLDLKKISFPLLLRKYKQGDYFYPLGMSKKKKISRFLIDAKLSLTQKEDIWVMESNKKIIWLVGLRIDDRFKVTTQTKSILQLQVK
ncbi:MAG TPA: tRNA lysidine(34) synthetase TilS [Chitinophagaceae bacterium]|nr:tRNA lysidine(34) synthetase TilS [Chitinophagaceae bacterium]HMZ46343.1 tRNA lysidine(34) synthetase TilS [Chitinophagaceae bacterium]HNE92887.1 tRNA lysidine(34) synthetase TilS [Chitinophagaceae bacterium]HNM34127.1 tRNA lysidine(34) synthetase TilS [Chitinophagaceae bacterium]HNN31841.1 tRNA lysidine(34) synthetase TilS [Chitinophagaceae bacterium]